MDETADSEWVFIKKRLGFLLILVLMGIYKENCQALVELWVNILKAQSNKKMGNIDF